MTSNGGAVVGEAFQSRIDLSLHYKPLDLGQRRKIWQNLASQFMEEDRLKSNSQRNQGPISGIGFNEILGHIGELAAVELNGHQIKNAMYMARKLAAEKGESAWYHRNLDLMVREIQKPKEHLAEQKKKEALDKPDPEELP